MLTLAPLLTWMLTETVLTALIVGLYLLLRHRAMAAGDRYLFLSLAFTVVLFLPFVPTMAFLEFLGPGQHTAISSKDVAGLHQLLAFPSSSGRPFLKPILISAVGAYAAAALVRMLRLFVGIYKLKALARGGTTIAHRGEVPVIATKGAFAPLTFGWLKPVILIPWALVEASPDEWEMALVHEEQHIARRDYLRNLMRLFVQAALVFLPWVHWLGNRFIEEMELSCDARTVERSRCSAKAYGSMLLRFATASAPRADLAIGLFMSQSFLSRRINSMQNLSRQPRLFVPIGAFASLTLIFGPALTALGIEGNVHAFVAQAQEGDKDPDHPTSTSVITADSIRTPRPGFMMLTGHVKLEPRGSTYVISADSVSSKGDDYIYKGHVEVRMEGTGSVVRSEMAQQKKDLVLLMDAAEITLGRSVPSKPEGDSVYLKWQKPTDLRVAIADVAAFTGKDVILDQDVHGSIAVANEGPVTKQEAYAVFVDALHILGLQAVESERSIKILAK